MGPSDEGLIVSMFANLDQFGLLNPWISLASIFPECGPVTISGIDINVLDSGTVHSYGDLVEVAHGKGCTWAGDDIGKISVLDKRSSSQLKL